MSKEQNEYVRTKKSTIEGYGLFAKKDIPWSVKIIEYKGKKIKESEITDQDDAVFELDEGWCINGRKNGNEAQFANHSRKNPNAFILREKSRIWLVAGIEGIKKNEEILYDYGTGFYAQESDT